MNIFRKAPSAEALAQQDLQEAKRLLLTEQAKAEYHAKMVEYYSDMVDRLTEFVGRQ